jgi:4-hydroxy-3-methylbut-2-enyl diphosphate reductase
VEKVWNKAAQIGGQHYTVVVHGKPSHEETRATFSHSRKGAPTIVIRDMAEAGKLADVIRGNISPDEFYKFFSGQYSEGFDVSIHLQRIGVVNQTTMLASDTQAIADFLKKTMMDVFRLDETTVHRHFADTRDTLCYATNDNQNAVYGLLKQPGDLAIVAGGYNSSNTSHLVELCEERLPTYFISSAEKIESDIVIHHFNYSEKKELTTRNWLNGGDPPTILMTCGASCPDSIVERIVTRITGFFENSRTFDDVMRDVERQVSFAS